MKISPIASTMFLLSAIATGRNTVTGFSTPLSRHVHKSSALFMNAQGGDGGGGGKLTKNQCLVIMMNRKPQIVGICFPYSCPAKHKISR